jgi:hypothetical protein
MEAIQGMFQKINEVPLSLNSLTTLATNLQQQIPFSTFLTQVNSEIPR